MNFLKKLFNTVTICCFSMLLMSLSCSKSDDDDAVVKPLRDYSTQYGTDLANIITYLKTHKLNSAITDYSANVNNSNLFLETTNVSESLWSLPSTGSIYPKLLHKEVKIESHMTAPYLVYYIVFNEGNTTEKPCPLDNVLVTYRGSSLANVSDVVSATEFENSPVSVLFNLNRVVSGWQEVFPLFGKGTFDEVATGNGPNVYTNYGAGIMFLPSGLGYYQQSSTNMPEYSPLVFSFQLQNFVRVDTDSDGIMTVDELVKNSEGNYVKESYIDTDGDNYYDFNDIDDDNDGFTTRNEIKDADGNLIPFIDIPTCTGGNGKKRHLDSKCHN